MRVSVYLRGARCAQCLSIPLSAALRTLPNHKGEIVRFTQQPFRHDRRLPAWEPGPDSRFEVRPKC